MANDLFTANAVKWLESIGYPVASLTTPMDAHVSRWWAYLLA